MNIAGLDIATTTGLCVVSGDQFRVSSFRPRMRRSGDLKKGAVDWNFVAHAAHEFRVWLLPELRAAGVRFVGIEAPLPGNISKTKAVIDTETAWAGKAITYEKRGGSNMAADTLTKGLVAVALEICISLNIERRMISQNLWRSNFIGVTRAPKGVANGTAWLKQKARERCDQLGIEVRNNDQSDAVGVAWQLRAELFPAQATLPGELFHGKQTPATAPDLAAMTEKITEENRHEEVRVGPVNEDLEIPEFLRRQQES